MKCEIDGRMVITELDFHNWWEKTFDLQGFYGKNLDALRDSLLGGVERPIHIDWINSGMSRASMGESFNLIVKFFKEAQEHDQKFVPSERFTFTLK